MHSSKPPLKDTSSGLMDSSEEFHTAYASKKLRSTSQRKTNYLVLGILAFFCATFFLAFSIPNILKKHSIVSRPSGNAVNRGQSHPAGQHTSIIATVRTNSLVVTLSHTVPQEVHHDPIFEDPPRSPRAKEPAWDALIPSMCKDLGKWSTGKFIPAKD